MTSLLFSNNDVISSDFPKKLKKNPKKTQCSATAVAPSFQQMAERESLYHPLVRGPSKKNVYGLDYFMDRTLTIILKGCTFFSIS